MSTRGKGKDDELDYWRDYFRRQDERDRELSEEGKVPHGLNVCGSGWGQPRYLYPIDPLPDKEPSESIVIDVDDDLDDDEPEWFQPEISDEEYYRIVHLPVIESDVLLRYRRHRADIIRYAIFTTLRQREIADLLSLDNSYDKVISIHFKNLNAFAVDLYGDEAEGERLFIQKRVFELRVNKRYTNARIARMLKRDPAQITRTLRALFKKMLPIAALHGASIPFIDGGGGGKRPKRSNLSEIEGG